MALKVHVTAAQTGQPWVFFFTVEEFQRTTVLQLKTKIRESEGVPEDRLQLIFAGWQLEDYWLLSDCGVKHKDNIYVDLIRMDDRRSRNQTSRFPVQVKSAAEAPDTREMAVKVKLHGFSVEERIVGLCDTEEQFKSFTVLQLKEKIQSVFGFSGYDVHVFFGTKYLEEDALLSAYGVKHMSEMYADLVIRGGGCGLGSLYHGMGDRDGRNKSMECVAIMLTGSDVSSESAPHPQPAAVEDLHKDSC